MPVLIGAAGVERVIEIELTAAERQALDVSVSHVRELVQAAEKFLPAS